MVWPLPLIYGQVDYNDSYISLTAHFITHSWQMVSCILATSPFPGQHTAVNIIEKLKEIMQSYELDFSNVIALVHDQVCMYMYQDTVNSVSSIMFIVGGLMPDDINNSILC